MDAGRPGDVGEEWQRASPSTKAWSWPALRLLVAPVCVAPVIIAVAGKWAQRRESALKKGPSVVAGNKLSYSIGFAGPFVCMAARKAKTSVALRPEIIAFATCVASHLVVFVFPQ